MVSFSGQQLQGCFNNHNTHRGEEKEICFTFWSPAFYLIKTFYNYKAVILHQYLQAYLVSEELRFSPILIRRPSLELNQRLVGQQHINYILFKQTNKNISVSHFGFYSNSIKKQCVKFAYQNNSCGLW